MAGTSTASGPATGRVELRAWLEAVARIARALNDPVALPALLDLVSETATRLLGYDSCAVLLPDESRRVLLITGSHGLDRDYVEMVNTEHPIVIDRNGAEGGETALAPSSRAFLDATPVQVTDAVDDESFLPWGRFARAAGIRSMISVPVLASGAPAATLNCYTRRPHDFGEPERDLLRLLADQAGVAIETARLRDHEAATIAELRTVNDALAEQHELLRRGEAVHEQLTEVALRGGGVAGVAAALAALLGSAVVVTEEPSGAELARVEGSGEPLVASDLGGAGALSTPVVLGHDTVARIWVPRTADRLPALDVRALEHAATVCALEVLRARTALDVEWRLSGELVRDLLTGQAAGVATAAERAARLGHDLELAHALVVVRPGASASRTVTRILSVARSLAATSAPRALVGTLEHDTVLLWPSETVAETTAAAVELRRQLQRLDLGDEVGVGVSAVCRSLADYPVAYRRTRGAVAMARLRPGRSARPEGADVATFESLGVHGLLLQLEDASELRRFADGLLAPVRDHDRARGTELEHTLRVHLEHDLVTAATASALSVHPNTVGLRVRRAEQLLGTSLSNVVALSELQVALSADDVAEALSTTP